MTTTTHRTDSTEVIRRLRAVTRRIEGFFDAQIQRLEQAMHQLNELQSEYEVARRLSADLDQQKTRWQDERDEEIVRLTQASESLARSWHELEQRQRDLLIVAQAQPAPPRPIARPVDVAVDPPVEQIRHETSLFEMQQLQLQVNEHHRRSR